jgi:hypothetical protein
MHLKDDELVDLAEGARPESSAPHLASCEPCRRQVRDLRALMSVAAGVDVPEPSPLYWDHMSARVRERVAMEASPRRPWLDGSAWRRVLRPASAAAVAALIIIVVGLGSRVMAPPPSPATSAALVVNDGGDVDLWIDPASEDDESLTLMASLSGGLDLEGVGDTDLATRGSAEHAVTHMGPDDLRELQRLLTQELTPSGV